MNDIESTSSMKPILAPNEAIDINAIRYPLLASIKYDGVRCIIKNGEMFTRSLKKFQNKNVEKRFAHVIQLSKELGVLFDGELFSDTVSFNKINGDLRRIDGDLPEDLFFYAFDCIVGVGSECSGLKSNIPFWSRLEDTKTWLARVPLVKVVEQSVVRSATEVKDLFEKVLTEGHEGLILRHHDGVYKFGRCTVKEANLFKVKPFLTFDSQIIEVEEGTSANEGTARTVNELGHSKTSRLKEDRHLNGTASTFVVLYEGLRLSVSLSSVKHPERKKIWEERNSYVGRFVEFKGMVVGAKDLPRHPVFIRFRDDKE